MTKIFKQLTLFLFCCFILYGCTENAISPDDISKGLMIDYVKGNEIKTSGYILVNITNTSSECISFPIDFGLQLYVIENGVLTNIKNKTTYTGDSPYIVNPNGDYVSEILIIFSPDLSMFSIKEETNFVAIIKGQLCDDESVIITKEIPFIVMP